MRRRTTLSKMPNADCVACGGFGNIHLTAHFTNGDQEFEAPCWECFGKQVSVNFPSPRKTDNA